jgi:hypothetical protein
MVSDTPNAAMTYLRVGVESASILAIGCTSQVIRAQLQDQHAIERAFALVRAALR